MGSKSERLLTEMKNRVDARRAGISLTTEPEQSQTLPSAGDLRRLPFRILARRFGIPLDEAAVSSGNIPQRLNDLQERIAKRRKGQ